MTLREEKLDYTTIPVKWLYDYEESLHRHIDAVIAIGEILGVPNEQLDCHDNSKFSMEEYSAYAQQFHGDKGDPNGFARAWLHHIHKNPHHWQHWIFPDNYDLAGADLEKGMIQIPEKYALEMIADWLGASKVYSGEWDMTVWLENNYQKIRLHSKTRTYVDEILKDIKNGIIFDWGGFDA